MKNPDRRRQANESGFEQLSFLPEPDFNPVWPRPNTLSARCLAMLLAGQAIDHLDFIERTGSWRLAAVIFELRALGWPVEAEEIPAPTADAPTRHICRYTLAVEAIQKVMGGA